MNDREFNFISKGCSKEDINLFLGPLDENKDGPFITIPDHFTTLAHIMHHVGIFSSVGEARKNGWNKPIDKGFSEFIVTKRKIKIYILTPFD